MPLEPPDCVRCNATMTWDGDLPDSAEDLLCDPCVRALRPELKARVAELEAAIKVTVDAFDGADGEVFDASVVALGNLLPTDSPTPSAPALHAMALRWNDEHGKSRLPCGANICRAPLLGEEILRLQAQRTETPSPDPREIVAELRAMADLYLTRPCAPSLDEYSQVDGLRVAADLVEKWIRAPVVVLTKTRTANPLPNSEGDGK